MRVRAVGWFLLLSLSSYAAVSAKGSWAAAGSPAWTQTAAGGARAAGRCRPLVFEGAVRAGESFRRQIGGGLGFELEAVRGGWVIRVWPTPGRRPAVDYAEVATPPFRSVNPLLLSTNFSFRSQDVIGWNPRHFAYARNGAAYVEAVRAYRAVLAHASPTPAEEGAVARVAAAALPGTLEILDSSLVPGSGDPTAGAALVASHFASTAHTVDAVPGGKQDRLGAVSGLRFRVTLALPDQPRCAAPMR